MSINSFIPTVDWCNLTVTANKAIWVFLTVELVNKGG